MATLAQLKKMAKKLETPVEINVSWLGTCYQVELWIESVDWVFNVNEAGCAIAEAETLKEAYEMAYEDLEGGIRPRHRG
jgi:hypothetical protein